ncbi:hypothetical protein AB0A63_31605 [Lentzea sp. NPDC042327]|uniref:hypothetical protein n=1 Tax=Lentzea sp. NPDC042327 TaxID=3154801 RepID=UPI0033D624F9
MLRPRESVHAELDAEQHFLTFSMDPAPVRQLWSPVPSTRSLSTPSTVPLLLGTVTPAAVLGALRAATAVARWPAGHRILSVLLTRPGGMVLTTNYPQTGRE